MIKMFRIPSRLDRFVLCLFGLIAFLGLVQADNQIPLAQAGDTCTLTPSNPSTFWLEGIPHEGTSPFITDGANWKVFRNVKDYGAKGDGVTDDTAAIQNAINDGGRDAIPPPHGVTGAPALVYIPAGTYIVSHTLQLFIQTSVVGDPLHMPVIKPTNSVGPNYVINANDASTATTNNFYISLRNVRIDTTAVDPQVRIQALNWAVSQATSLTNIEIIMPDGDCQHEGIVMYGHGTHDFSGSNTMFGDLSISGGNVGIRISGQQLLLKSINVTDCRTAIAIDNFSLLVLQRMSFTQVGTCIDNYNGSATGLYLIDSTANNTGPVIIAHDSPNGDNSILIENFINTGGQQQTVVLDNVSPPAVSGNVDTWVHGNVYVDNSNDPTRNHIQRGIHLPKTVRSTFLLDSSDKIFVKKMPQYEKYDYTQIASVKSFGAKGDGQADDAEAINRALAQNANCKITYFPHGVYKVSSTIFVPSGSRLVGEVWSVITGSGAFFGNENDPKPIMQVGEYGSSGLVELTDMLFTINDVLPGAVLLEVNMASTAQGDVSLHNTHFRVGGAIDSNVNSVCGDRSPAQCMAGFLLLHLTKSSSAYLEDIWGWTADHPMEPNWSSTYISTGRGFLIESQKATWMMGVAPEHQTLYGLNVVNAENVYIAMIQVETPYWQPHPPSDPSVQAPGPWTANSTWSDPDFSNCDGSDPLCYRAWGVRVSGGSGILVYGAGCWLFFDNFYGDFTKPQCDPCQVNAYEIVSGPTESYFYGLGSKAVENMVWGQTENGNEGVLATQAMNPAGWGGHIAAYLGYFSN